MNNVIVGRFFDLFAEDADVRIARFRVLATFRASSGRVMVAMENQHIISGDASEICYTGTIEVMNFSYVMDNLKLVESKEVMI